MPLVSAGDLATDALAAFFFGGIETESHYCFFSLPPFTFLVTGLAGRSLRKRCFPFPRWLAATFCACFASPFLPPAVYHTPLPLVPRTFC